MIRVDYSEPSSAEWKQWKAAQAAQAAKARDAFKAGDPPPEVGDPIDEDRKAEIREAFHRKCAFCEAPITIKKPGNVRRYRPPSQVYDIDGNRVRITAGDLKFLHPGYFWLANEPSNLLYTCSGCAPKDERKRDCFPVLGDEYGWPPGKENDEVRLLFHPIDDDPEQFLNLDGGSGILVGADERAQVSIEVLGLNREELRDVRSKTFAKVSALLESVCNANPSKPDQATFINGTLDTIVSSSKPSHPYSFVYRSALKKYRPRIKPLLDELLALASRRRQPRP